MLRTFNLGVGMTLVVDGQAKDEQIRRHEDEVVFEKATENNCNIGIVKLGCLFSLI